MAGPFFTPASSKWEFLFLYVLNSIWCCQCSRLCHSNGYVMVSHGDSFCNFLMTYDVERLLLCLLAIYIFILWDIVIILMALEVVIKWKLSWSVILRHGDNGFLLLSLSCGSLALRKCYWLSTFRIQKSRNQIIFLLNSGLSSQCEPIQILISMPQLKVFLSPLKF